MSFERRLLEDGLQQVIHKTYPQAVDKLLCFSEMLREKNKVMNLTAITDPLDIITHHFLDCAGLIEYIEEGTHVIDIGTGAGFPGIPLAILDVNGNAEYILLDAQQKRVNFLCEVIEELKLDNCTAVHARAEDYAKEHRECFDTAVSRAVADLRVLCELSLPLVKPGGKFLAMKAASCREEVAAAENAVSVLGGAPVEVDFYEIPFINNQLIGNELVDKELIGSKLIDSKLMDNKWIGYDKIQRAVVRIEKRSETPERYPRRFKRIQTDPL